MSNLKEKSQIAPARRREASEFLKRIETFATAEAMKLGRPIILELDERGKFPSITIRVGETVKKVKKTDER